MLSSRSKAHSFYNPACRSVAASALDLALQQPEQRQRFAILQFAIVGHSGGVSSHSKRSL